MNKKGIGKCYKCKNKAVVVYADEPLFALTHGFGGIHLCRLCYIELIINNLKEIVDNLQSQLKLCKKEK